MIDFQALKANLRIEEVAKRFIECAEEGDVLRGSCPVCAPRNPRAIIITPEKQLYYCFTAKKGGDLISLVAHVRNLSQRDAAKLLAVSEREEEPEHTGTLEPLKYLQAEHPLVTELGFSRDVCEAVGIGYASKGLMRTHVAIPIRMPDGVLVGYIGVKAAQLPPKWRLPDAR
jgi:DNA primase